MTDTMIFLSAALIAAGVYIMYLHSLLSRYRAWSRQAAALLAMVAYGKDGEPEESRADALKAEREWRAERAEKEYGFDLHPRSNYDEDK